MARQDLIHLIKDCINRRDGKQLTSIFVIDNPNITPTTKNSPLSEIPSHWRGSINALLQVAQTPASEYEKFSKITSALIVTASQEERWALPLLSGYCEKLFYRATERDQLMKLADIVRQVVRLTVTDRNEDLKVNRCWGRYAAITLLFRIYYRLKAYAMIDTVVGGLVAHNDEPPLKKIPANEQAEFLFYAGITDFAGMRYEKAVEELQKALLAACQAHASIIAQEAILIYLVPAKLSYDRQFPTEYVWEKFPTVKKLYWSIFRQVRLGNYEEFLKVVETKREVLVKNRLYFSIDTLANACLLRLVLRTWKLSDRPRRLPVSKVQSALRVAGHPDSKLDAELLLARFISNGDIKGRIEHDLGLLLLSDKQPFPRLVRPKD